MTSRIMNTKEISKYLGINEKKIYRLIMEKKLPATKITGKWIFLKERVDMWLERSVESKRTLFETKGILMITGSDDLLLNQIMNKLGKGNSQIFSFFCKTGSLNGLFVLKDGKAHIAGTHLFDEESKEYNLPFVDRYLGASHTVIINIAKREQGLLVKRGNPKHIKSIEDISKKDAIFINRQKGSGTRNLLDSLLKRLGISPLSIKGYKREVTTHLEVGLNILNGYADCGLGIKAVSNILGMEFVPLVKERYDIVVIKDLFFSKPVQMFLELLRSIQFKRIAHKLGGYDTKDSGKIII